MLRGRTPRTLRGGICTGFVRTNNAVEIILQNLDLALRFDNYHPNPNRNILV